MDISDQSRAEMSAERRARSEDAFIDVIADGYSVSRACEAARIDRKTAFEWRDEDPGFAARWADAEERAARKLCEDAVVSLQKDSDLTKRQRACRVAAFKAGRAGDFTKLDRLARGKR